MGTLRSPAPRLRSGCVHDPSETRSEKGDTRSQRSGCATHRSNTLIAVSGTTTDHPSFCDRRAKKCQCPGASGLYPSPKRAPRNPSRPGGRAHRDSKTRTCRRGRGCPGTGLCRPSLVSTVYSWAVTRGRRRRNHDFTRRSEDQSGTPSVLGLWSRGGPCLRRQMYGVTLTETEAGSPRKLTSNLPNNQRSPWAVERNCGNCELERGVRRTFDDKGWCRVSRVRSKSRFPPTGTLGRSGRELLWTEDVGQLLGRKGKSQDGEYLQSGDGQMGWSLWSQSTRDDKPKIKRPLRAGPLLPVQDGSE